MKSVNCHNGFFRVISKVVTALILFVSVFANAQDVDLAKHKQGKVLFKQCASCHKLDKPLVGPALGKVSDRRSKEWLYKWIRNSGELRASGDKEAKAIFAEWNNVPMPAFPQLKDEELDAIIYYTTIGKIKKPSVVGGPDVSEEQKGARTPGWVLMLLAAAVAVACLIIMNLLKTIGELKGGPKTKGFFGQASDLWFAVKKNTFLHVLFVLFGVLVGAYVVFGTLFKVGVDQGYKPVQPILFSHKIHAGDNKIDCQYCHSSAKHSKHSGIPSANVCMNCHKNISEVADDTKVVLEDRVVGKAELDKEIVKLYDAVGWNPKGGKTGTGIYTGVTKNIEWIRIHNLPDFAYFNHSQHVTVAGVKCQKCHGPVEEMEELYQHAPLTMGWCIDCHKKTEVDLKGNAYYAKIHKELADKYGVDKVTIAQLGGKECGKCHY